MNKIDFKLTEKIQDWLNTPASQRDIAAGAMMYLQLSRNQALYNSVMRKPEKFYAKLEYELRKFLRIRLDKMTIADVSRMESEITPRVVETIGEETVISTDNEFPEGVTARGKRMDHASLPPEIQELWDSNAGRYRKIVILFNELKTMSGAMPCDRYEKLRMLDELDRTYRANLERYDNFEAVAANSPSGAPADSLRSVFPSDGTGDSCVLSAPAVESAAAADVARKISAARKFISSNKKVLAKMDAQDPMTGKLRAKIQDAVDTVRTLGGGFADRQESELSSLGINLN